jgi:hypothetical protein
MAKGKKTTELTVFGATLQGFAQACINLNIVAGAKAENLLGEIEITGWYPFEKLREIERVVVQVYENSGPILERVGMEMMLGWYSYGPGKEIIKKGVDFLHFQTGSQGYASVVKGPEASVGSFKLEFLEEEGGRARINSTTPFNKDMERGVIIGGMTAPGDLDFIDVKNDEDPQIFQIEFA